MTEANVQAFKERRLRQVCVVAEDIIDLLEWRRRGYVSEVSGPGVPSDAEVVSIHFDNSTLTYHICLCSPEWEPVPEGHIVDCALDVGSSPYFRRKIIRGSEDEWHLVADKRENERLLESEEAAWEIIANAYGGDWNLASESSGWKKAAERWRDGYHQGIKQRKDPRSEYGIVGGVAEDGPSGFLAEVCRKVHEQELACMENVLKSIIPPGTRDQQKRVIEEQQIQLINVLDDEYDNPNCRTELWRKGDKIGEFVRWYEDGKFAISFEPACDFEPTQKAKTDG